MATERKLLTVAKKISSPNHFSKEKKNLAEAELLKISASVHQK